MPTYPGVYAAEAFRFAARGKLPQEAAQILADLLVGELGDRRLDRPDGDDTAAAASDEFQDPDADPAAGYETDAARATHTPNMARSFYTAEERNIIERRGVVPAAGDHRSRRCCVGRIETRSLAPGPPSGTRCQVYV